MSPLPRFPELTVAMRKVNQRLGKGKGTGEPTRHLLLATRKAMKV